MDARAWAITCWAAACLTGVVAAAELVAVEGCTLVAADWADGDSFPVRTTDGVEHTVRLYGADCLEQHVSGETDARRLRGQRRYFGITNARPDAAASIALAKDLARESTEETRRFLARPFTIHTSFADARGDGRHKRIYAFVFDAEGRDLAAHLISAGLARAYGVGRTTLAGESAEEYRESLADLELQAAKRGVGIWAHTDWESLPAERRRERDEARELNAAVDGAGPPPGFVVEINSASREDLMRLPRVGETLANRIIERRPYRRLTDLLEVDGIGPSTYRDLKPMLRIDQTVDQPAAEPAAPAVPAAELEAARAFLRANPPDGTNASARRRHMAAIQRAADGLAPGQYMEYAKSWTTDAARADEIARAAALRYLETAVDETIADIRATRVRSGVVAWHLYNMGYVFKTPDCCFGIDLHCRAAPRLVTELDFLLVSHEHMDHRSDALVAALLERGKPVVTSFQPGTRRIDATRGESQELTLGGLRVRIDIGDHHYKNPRQRNNMLMFQVDCGAAGNDCTIYHAGDNSNLEKMKPDRPVTIFIPHVEVGLPIEASIRTLDPRITFVSHVLELGHSPTPPQAWRWSFDHAFKTIANVPEPKATVLTWGERWLLPGTEIVQP